MATPTLPPTVAIAANHARAALGLQGPLPAGWAPGRVNLIGEHTDYNDGFVLPIAVERTVAMAGQLASDPADMTVRLFSAHHQETAQFDAANPPSARDPRGVPLWARYVAGAVSVVQAAGMPMRGFSAAIAGDVPLGGGMSSSAALIMATLTWLDAALGLQQGPLELARIGQRAETLGSGVQVGILDQAASALGKPGKAIFIDCRSLAYHYISFNLPDVALLVCETGVERSLADVGYNTRRQECEAAAQAFAQMLQQEDFSRLVTALRDVTERDYARLAGAVPQPERRRARHVITENDRVGAAVQALQAGDAAAFTDLLLRSHASLRDDYEVSCPELDAVVAIATRGRPLTGARLMGAGFGGSALIIAPLADIPAIQADLARDYPAQTGRTPTMHQLAPAGGPGATTLP